MEYPKRFTECPVCRSTNRIIENEVKAEIELGHLKPNTKIPVIISQSQIVDLQNQSILLTRRQFPVIIGFYDVCSDCGTLYCCEINKAVGIAEARLNSRPPNAGIGPIIGN